MPADRGAEPDHDDPADWHDLSGDIAAGVGADQLPAGGADRAAYWRRSDGWGVTARIADALANLLSAARAAAAGPKFTADADTPYIVAAGTELPAGGDECHMCPGGVPLLPAAVCVTSGASAAAAVAAGDTTAAAGRAAAARD